MTNNDKSKLTVKKSNNRLMYAPMGIGVGLGIALGAAVNKIAIGLVLGIAVGGLGVLIRQNRTKREEIK